jgi:hypothetical protein
MTAIKRKQEADVFTHARNNERVLARVSLGNHYDGENKNGKIACACF